jgi:quercetin dioxygenase-like cupin family protein
MSKAGDVFDNPVTRETGFVRLGTEETDGDLMVVDLQMPASDGPLLPMHVHPGHSERFIVVEGEIAFIRGDEKGVVHPGGEADIPPGSPHGWWNIGTQDARVIVEVRPAARFEQLSRTVFGLVREGKTNPKGMPNPLQAAVLAQEFGDVIVFTSPPAWVQRILYGLLAPLGRVLGYRATYARHRQIPVASVELEPLPDGVTLPGA